jgi:lipopolysaccharide heptosyltransferase II
MSATLDRGSIRKILVIKLRAIGDVLLSTVVLNNLRKAFPSAAIDFLTEPPARDVVDGHPAVNRTIVYDLSRQGPVGYLTQIRRERYDLVFDLFGNPRTALLTRASGARHRVGYAFRGRQYAYNVVVRGRGDTVHNTQFNLDALEAVGIPVVDRSLAFPLRPEDLDYVQEFVRNAGLFTNPIVALNTSGGWYTKRWPLERFAELADRIAAELGASIVLTWGPGQKEDAKRVGSLMTRPAFVPPPTTLRQLAALLQRCAFMVTNDSGPMHIAAAVGTPVLGIYGPTNPLLQGPYGQGHLVVRQEGLECLSCNLTQCPVQGHPCMNDLGTATVFEAVRRLASMHPARLKV